MRPMKAWWSSGKSILILLPALPTEAMLVLATLPTLLVTSVAGGSLSNGLGAWEVGIGSESSPQYARPPLPKGSRSRCWCTTREVSPCHLAVCRRGNEFRWGPLICSKARHSVRL